MIMLYNYDDMSAVAVKYELLALEELVRDELTRAQSIAKVTSFTLKKWREFADAEVNRIRSAITTQVLSLAKPRHVELYIQHHQAAIIYLSDQLFNATREQQKGNPGTGQRLLTEINMQLLDLLSFLEHYFESFFDRSLAIPLLMREIVAKEFGQLLRDFNNAGLQETAHQLMTIIIAPIETIAKNRQVGVSFHEISYYRRLAEEVLSISPGVKFNCQLIERLFRLNYNAESFRNYSTWQLTKELQEQEDKEGQLKFIAAKIKELKQLSPLSKQPLEPDKAGITDYFINWLTEEFDYLRKTGTWLTQGNSKVPTELTTRFLGTTSLTINQLGIFLHLLQQGKILHHKNQTAFLQFFAQHFTTKDRAPISSKSLRNGYYDYDPKTISEIQDLLHQLLKHLKEMDP